MSVRTYNPSVRVGNWNEDIQLEEDTLKDFLERRERGELLIQKTSNLKDTITKQMQVSISRDGLVHYGDIVMLINPEPNHRSAYPRPGPTALAINMSGATMHNSPGLPTECPVSGVGSVEPSARTCFVITSATGARDGDVLRYGEPFYIKAASGELYLSSDKATFSKCAKKSRNNEVSLVNATSYLTNWKVTPFDPTYRLELDCVPVPSNEKILITHEKTGHHLCLEAKYQHRSAFGMEYEISSFTSLDSHKAEQDVNHWMIGMSKPGDGSMPAPE